MNYRHFYGGFDTIATSRRWYRREVRCVRLGKDIRPYQGAQGFRVGPDYWKIRARPTAAEMFHYGWARPAHFKPEHLRYYASDWIERLTGARLWEFRNYEVV